MLFGSRHIIALTLWIKPFSLFRASGLFYMCFHKRNRYITLFCTVSQLRILVKFPRLPSRQHYSQIANPSHIDEPPRQLTPSS